MKTTSVFFTSDTHFGHANILKYCSRPFEEIRIAVTTEAMKR